MSASLNISNRVLSQRETKKIQNEIDSLKRIFTRKIDVPTNKYIKESVPERRKGKYEKFLDPKISVFIDKDLILRQIKKKEDVLKKMGVPAISKYERQKLEKEANRIREWLKNKMISRKMNGLKHDRNNPDFERAVQGAMVSFTPEYQRMAQRYKTIMRIISDNPSDSNLELIRSRI